MSTTNAFMNFSHSNFGLFRVQTLEKQIFGGSMLTLLSAPDLYTASARFRVAFPLEYSPKVYQSTEPKRQETIY